MNPYHINEIKITNFKSIKYFENLNCKKVNIIIGKPNVGKSNILEAISLLDKTDNISKNIRFKNSIELFYDKNIIHSNIVFYTNLLGLTIGKHQNNKLIIAKHIGLNNDEINDIDKLLIKSKLYNKDDGIEKLIINNEIVSIYQSYSNNLSEINYLSGTEMINSNIKKYIFKPDSFHNETSNNLTLNSPNGDNLGFIIQSDKNIRNEIKEIFKEYELEFLLNSEDNSFEIQKKSDDISYKFGYHLIADTLQRYIFHFAAISSNQNSVILFEEPESHLYPAYIHNLTIEIANSETNQFFITTHSDHLMRNLISYSGIENCSVWVCRYENHETKVEVLSNEKLNNYLENGYNIILQPSITK